jgi:RNA polymerase sigma-70 factor (ECF subfamily)
MGRFEPRHEGAFLAYLRKILVNQIRDEIGRAARMGQCEPLDDELPSSDRTPLQEAIGQQVLEAYDTALSRLGSRHQQAVVLRIELGYNHRQVAEAMGCISPNAARLLVARALVRLASILKRHDHAR